MSVEFIVLIILLVALLGGLPIHTYSHDWGYTPSISLGAIVIIVLLVMIFKGR